MNDRRSLLVAGVGVVGLLFAWLLFVGLPRWVATARPVTPGAISETPAEPERKIKARLYYVSEDGHGLTGIERECGTGPMPGAGSSHSSRPDRTTRRPPLGPSAGTTLRAAFVANGDAYVDVSNDIVTGHPGGSLNEQLTVQTIVSAVMTNLPAIGAVQILIEGKEVDTLAGHVDLRQPLVKNADWIQDGQSPSLRVASRQSRVPEV